MYEVSIIVNCHTEKRSKELSTLKEAKQWAQENAFRAPGKKLNYFHAVLGTQTINMTLERFGDISTQTIMLHNNGKRRRTK